MLVYAGVFVSGIMYWGSAVYAAIACRPRGGTSSEAYVAGLDYPACSITTGSAPLVCVIQAVVTVITDFYIFFLPLPAVCELKLPFKRKLGVVAVFLVAFG